MCVCVVSPFFLASMTKPERNERPEAGRSLAAKRLEVLAWGASPQTHQLPKLAHRIREIEMVRENTCLIGEASRRSTTASISFEVKCWDGMR